MKHEILVPIFISLILIPVIQVDTVEHNSTYIEKIDDVFHIWNEKNHYYINESGFQITNHYQEFWTKNVWCLWINGNRRCSDGMAWDWVNVTDGYSWVELNGTATYSEGNYSAIFRISYYLENDMNNIKVSVGLKNTGKDVDDLDFGWVTKDIKIANNYPNDVISLMVYKEVYNETCGNRSVMLPRIEEWDLKNESLDVKYNESQLVIRHYALRDNISKSSVDLSWGEKGWKNGIEYNTSYVLRIKSWEGQYNAPNLLRIKAGKVNNGDIVHTNFWWSDADYTESCTGTGGPFCEDPCGCAYCSTRGEGCIYQGDPDCLPDAGACLGEFACPDPIPYSHRITHNCQCQPAHIDCQICDLGPQSCHDLSVCVPSGSCQYNCDEGYDYYKGRCAPQEITSSSNDQAGSSSDLTITDSANASYDPDTLVASCGDKWYNENWYFIMFNTGQSGTISYVNATFYNIYADVNPNSDTFAIMCNKADSSPTSGVWDTLWSGTSLWTTAENRTYNISDICGIDTFSEINQTRFKITSTDKSGGEDTVNWYVDAINITPIYVTTTTTTTTTTSTTTSTTTTVPPDYCQLLFVKRSSEKLRKKSSFQVLGRFFQIVERYFNL